MKTGTILLLFLLIVLVAACSKTASETQEQGTAQANVQANTETADTTPTDNTTLVIEDENLETELVSDPVGDIGTLDELPVDDSIPE